MSIGRFFEGLNLYTSNKHLCRHQNHSFQAVQTCQTPQAVDFEDNQYEREERAAIMEFDGKLFKSEETKYTLDSRPRMDPPF